MKRTSTMVSLVEDYLTVRRQLGFALEIAGEQLLAFARFADKAGHRGPVTFDLAVRWAQASPCPALLTSARRFEVLRPFLTYRSQFDARTVIVPRNFFGPPHRRLVPHIYTEQEIAALLQATDDLLPTDGLRPMTYRTLFGLLAATGLRISEALHLQPQDVDLVHGILTVRQTKFRKSRLVPFCTRRRWQRSSVMSKLNGVSSVDKRPMRSSFQIAASRYPNAPCMAPSKICAHV